MLASMRNNGLRLALFALGCTAVVALTDHLTRPTIARQQQQLLQQRLSAMLPAGSYDNDLAASCRLMIAPQALGDARPHPVYVALRNDQPSGYIIESVAAEGYAGAIRLLTAVDADGRLLRLEVLEHHETPGLGDKIERSKGNWLDGFVGRSLGNSRWAVKKEGGDFDSFSGATITPRAVVNGVHGLLQWLATHPDMSAAPRCQTEQ